MVLENNDADITCWVADGVPRKANGDFPSCGLDTNGSEANAKATITNFGTIKGGTSIQVVVRATIPSTAIATIDVTTYDDHGTPRIIDQSASP
jgi:hypothetical protein